MTTLKLYPYHHSFAKKFQLTKTKIAKTIGNFEIQHIGSSAVLGLGGKGIIDIMIGVTNWKAGDEVVAKLKKIGFNHVHPKEQGRIFLSKAAKTKFGDTHIHLLIKGKKQYNEMLAFRDYLRKNKDEAREYNKLKNELARVTDNDRKKYTKGKNDYIKKITKKAILK